MGSYSHMLLNGYPIDSCKGGYFEEMASQIFTKEDFILEQRPVAERSKFTWGIDIKKDASIETYACFRQTAKVCRDRLWLFGANEDLVRASFPTKEWLVSVGLASRGITDFESYKSFMAYELKAAVSGNKEKADFEDFGFIDGKPILSFNDEDDLSDRLYILSTLCFLDDDATVEYELVDIYHAGYINDKEGDRLKNEKLIILTEGKTDIKAIEAGFRMHYPHLLPFVHFMDFETPKVKGSASQLVHYVKSFIGSGIDSKIVAIFDHDAAAYSAMKQLEGLSVPSNIKIKNYPDIDLAHDYPTIGPDDNSHGNVNGRACGIEMYMGEKNLMDEEGNLRPVVWGGFQHNIKEYQGSIDDKGAVQEAFEADMANRPNPEDCPELKALVEVIINAFQ